MRQDLCLLSDDCPSLLFNGKFADLVALNSGDALALRPVLGEETRARLDSLPGYGTDTALVVGGNGFVGAHVVARLSRDPRIRMVLATVRGSEGRGSASETWPRRPMSTSSISALASTGC